MFSLDPLPVELRKMIAEELKGDEDDNPNWRQDLIHLAQSSRIIGDSALEVLWRDMSQIEPLLFWVPDLRMIVERSQSVQSFFLAPTPRTEQPRCSSYTWFPFMPPIQTGATQQESGVSISYLFSPDVDKWARFDKNRIGMRSLQLIQRIDFDYGIINRVTEFRGAPLCPGLTNLEWYHRYHQVFTSEVVSILSNFITPCLRSLRIDGGGTQYIPDHDPLLESFFNALPDGLCELYLSGYMPNFRFDFLSRLKHLKSLDISPLHIGASFVTPSVLNAITGLDALEMLGFSPNDILPTDVLDGCAFPKLEVISLQDTMLQTVTAIMRKVSSATLRKVYAVDEADRANIATIEEFNALCSQLSRFSTLTHVDLGATDIIQGEGNPDDLILMDAIQPLLKLHQLESFLFDVPGTSSTYVVRDDDIEQMASAWPNLENFELQLVNCSALSVRSLVSFAEHCPKLENLMLCRVYIPTTVDAESFKEYPNSCLSTLHFNEGLYVDASPSCFAGVLFRLFPCLDIPQNLKNDDFIDKELAVIYQHLQKEKWIAAGMDEDDSEGDFDEEMLSADETDERELE